MRIYILTASIVLVFLLTTQISYAAISGSDLDWTTLHPQSFISFGIGCGLGYGFATRTAIAALKSEIQSLQKRVKELEGKYENRTDQLIDAVKGTKAE